MKRRLLRASSINVVVGLLLTIAIALSVAGVALAAWSDVSPTMVAQYGVSEEELEGISQGYGDGTWKPGEPMLRKHFIKMAVVAFGVSQVTPAVPTFSDVLPSDPYYPYVEGASAAGLTTGVGGGKFAPNATITREQAVAMIARWLAQERGVDLTTAYDSQSIATALAAFSDAGSIAAGLRDEMAYAVDESVTQGSGGLLQPKKSLSRIQGAAMLIRARNAAGPTSTTTSTVTSSTTTTTISGSTTTSSSSTTSSTSSTTSSSTTSSSTTSSSTSTTLAAGARVFGKVLDQDGVAVVGATVKVVLNAGDSNYVSGGNNTIGTDTTDSQGNYEISTASLPLGSVVDVSVVAAGHTSVLCYGTYNQTAEEVSFASFGAAGGDRRMPVGDQMPPFPFEGLLPE